ncbi:flavin reductase family protein [Bosea vaviloviae]|uniref:flavin reductase family protein n=1 Tax=Bosea vaviloviae TaxID=1526658 RepID=UPI0009F73AB8|nr:flavin reductase family protein [Bosea vaviloviae]
MIYTDESANISLAHDPLKAIVAPRPIGWITAQSAGGAINLSPYSFFNAVATRPHLVSFCSEGKKDAVTFIEETREFTCSFVSKRLADAMNETSADLPRGQSEYAYSKLGMEASRYVRPPRVSGTPAALECKLISVLQMRDIEGTLIPTFMVIGQVVGIYIDAAYLRDGRFDTAAANPVARCGYADYAEVNEMFCILPPSWRDRST